MTYASLNELLNSVSGHAGVLTGKADELKNQYSNITANSEDALIGKKSVKLVNVSLFYLINLF